MSKTGGDSAMAPSIAVVVTAYNKGPYIGAALASLAAQTSLPQSIVVVDDGSTDDSATVADRFAAAHPELSVRVVRQANSGQPAHARNAGIPLTSSDVVICLDADDMLSPLYLQAVQQAFVEDPGLGLVYPDILGFTEEGDMRMWPSHDWSGVQLSQQNLCPCVTAFRREIWDRVGGYRTNVRGYEDWDFWLAAASLGYRGKRLPFPFFNYRELASGVFASTHARDLALRASIVQNNPTWYSLVTHDVAARILRDEPVAPLDVWDGLDEILRAALLTAARHDAADAMAWAARCVQDGSVSTVLPRLLAQVKSGRIGVEATQRLGAIYLEAGQVADGQAMLLLAYGNAWQARVATETPRAGTTTAVMPTAATNAPRVLCWMPYGQWTLHAQHEQTILHGARWRGAEVRYVMCSGLFRSCDMHWEAVRPRDAQSCASCMAMQARTANGLQMPFEWISTLVSEEERAEAARWSAAQPVTELTTARWQSWDIGPWIVSSIHSQFRTNVVDPHNADHERVLRAHLEAGLLVAFAMQRLLVTWKPDVLFLFNGRMGVLRVAFELAQAAGVRIVTHERGWTAGTLYLAENADCLSLAPLREAWSRWVDTPLTEPELKRTEGWLLDRAFGRNLNWRRFSPPPGSDEAVRTQLALRADAPLFVLYTSSEDEVAGNRERQSVFGSQAAWLEATAAWAAKHPEVDLVIRVHPNTGGRQSTGHNAEQLQWLQAFARTTAPSVRFVWPDDDVSSYTLMDMATVTLSYLSTTGLEAACRGKPAIMGASAYIGGYGFTDDVSDVALYGAQLDRYVVAPESEEAVLARRTRAWRFAYLAMVRYMVPFPLVPQRDFSAAGLGYTSLDALQPGRDAGLDHAVSVLLDGAPVCPSPDGSVLRSASTEAAHHRAVMGAMAEAMAA
ncbi:MAG: glycosyltransferase [Gemmatimonadaceae bacterium]|nr:glycosyltransferase [Gemmatimonadaceae bacterium]